MSDDDAVGHSGQEDSHDTPAAGDERSNVAEPATAGTDSETSDQNSASAAEQIEPDSRDLPEADDDYDYDDEYDEEAEDDSYTRRNRATTTEETRFLRGYGVDRNEFEGNAAFGPHSVAGDVFNFLSSAQTRSGVACRPVGGGYIAEVRLTYFPPQTHSDVATALHRQGLIFLDGKAGAGRETTACVVLAERHGNDRVAVISLGDGLTMADAANEIVDGVRAEYGHLFLLREGQPIDLSVLAHLQRRAADCQATVVLLGDVSPMKRAALHQYAVRHQSPPLVEVFQRHLHHELTGSCVAECVDCDGSCLDPYVSECLAESHVGDELRRLSSPREAVEAACRLAERRPGPTDAGKLLEQLAVARIRQQAMTVLRPAGDAEDRYREELVRHQRGFRICYALLHRLPLRDVFEATDELLPMLDQARGRTHDEHPTYDIPVEDLLGPVLGSPGPQMTSQGSGYLAHLSDERLMPSILDVLWNDYGGFREPLCAWLDKLVRKDRWPVRQRAATIAGVLAGYDFEQVSSCLINKWARSGKQVERQVAAYAIEVATLYNEGVSALVQEEVGVWAASSSSKHQRDTAARCYATGYGRRFPQDALEHLKSIADDRMQLSRSLIADAVAGLADNYPVEKVFEALATWLHPLSSPVASHGVRAFGRLASRCDADGVSTLMRRFIDGAIDKFQLATVWSHALERPATARPAWKALEQWISALDSDSVVQSGGEVARDLLAGVFNNPALRRRGRFYLTYVWRRNLAQGDFRWFAQTLEEVR